MEIFHSARFERNYAKAPRQIQRAFDKQSHLLLQNLHHPSLRAKKYDESRDLWQARVKIGAFIFSFRAMFTNIVDIIPHPK